MSALQIRYGAPQALPLDLLLSTLPSLPRAALNRLVERAIDHLDTIDGDPDIEPNGDERDTANAEDEPFVGQPWGHIGPGCVISDSDCGVDDDGEDDRSSDV